MPRSRGPPDPRRRQRRVARRTRLPNRQVAAFHARHLQDVLDESSHPGGGALDDLRGPSRSPFRFRSAPPKESGLQRDGIERIAKIVGYEAEYLIPDLRRLD